MGLLTRLFVWALGFAFRWVLLLSLVLLVVALHPPTLAALVSKMAMAIGGGGAGTGKGKKKRQELKRFQVQSISLLRFRLEGLEATVVEGREASVVLLKTMELRPTIKAALLSFFQTKLFEVRLVGIHAKKVPWTAAALSEEEEPAGAPVQEAKKPAPESDGPFAAITQDAKTWHRLVWLSKMVKLTVEDVSFEATTPVAMPPPPPPPRLGGNDGRSSPKFACVSGGLQSFTVAATHVVHPRQVLSLDLNVKGLWARGVGKESVDEAGGKTFAQLDVEGMAVGMVLEPLDARPASAYFAVQGTPTVRVDPAHMLPPPPPVTPPPSPSAAEAAAAVTPSPAAVTPGPSTSSSTSSRHPAGLKIDPSAPSTIPPPPPKPPKVDVGALPKRGFFSLPGLDIAIVGPDSRALRITTAMDLTWVSSNMAAVPSSYDRLALERPLPPLPPFGSSVSSSSSSTTHHHRRHSTKGLEIIRRKTLRGGGDMDMSISHILEDAERDEEQAEAAAAPAAAAGEQPLPREKGGEEGRYRVCVVPRVACREVKVALEGVAEPVFHLQEWNTEALVEVGLSERDGSGGGTGLFSPRTHHRLPSPSSFRTLAAAAAAAAASSSSSGSATHHPHKGHLLRAEMHAEVQRLAVHASGAFLRWAKGMHALAAAATGGKGNQQKKKAPSNKTAADPSSPMVPHEATLRLRVFSLVADRLEDWEDENASIGVSGSSGINAGLVAHPHARYEMLARDVVASSTATRPRGGVGGRTHQQQQQQQQQQQRPFFRQRSASGGGIAGGSLASPVAIPSSSDDNDEDAAAETGRGGQRPSLLHTLGFRSGDVTAQVRIAKPDAHEEAARVAAGGRQRVGYLLSEVQEPSGTCFRFRVAGMQGESQQAMPLVATADRKPLKPDMKVKIGAIIGEEGLIACPVDGEGGGAFVGLQFLCFPSMSVVMGEEAENAQVATATQELLAAIADTSSLSSPGRDGGGGGLDRADSCGGTGGRGAGQQPPTTRELLTAHAEKAYVRASFDLAIRGLMLGDVQKRTQAAVKRFTESLNPSSTAADSKKGETGGGRSSPVPLPPALSPLRRGMAMHLLVDAFKVELVLANPTGGKDEGTKQQTDDEGPGTFTAILVEMKDCRMSMFERHRRVPMASLAAAPGSRVPSIMEMVMDVGVLSMTAAAGEATGKMLEAVELWACYEKVPAFFPDAGLKCVVLAQEMTVIVPPNLHLGAVIAAGTSQKAALDTAMRRWEETFHGRDFSVPRKFMPNIIRALFRKGKVRLCQEPAAKTEQREEKAAMEMRLTEWRVHMDMDKPNEELRAIAQRLDSDRDAKEFGAVVGGKTLIGAETLEVHLGALPSSVPMLAAHGGFRIKGIVVGAAPAPDPALCAPGSTSLTHIGRPAARSLAFPESSLATPPPALDGALLPPAVVFPTVKDGLAIKVYGDAAVEMDCVRAVYGPALLPLLDAVNTAVARATPPSSIPEPHPLPWWDKMRYQIHGTWLVTAQEMHLLHLTAPTYESMSGPLLEASAVSLHLSKASIFLQRALHEFCFHRVVVALPSHAPPTEVRAWAHPPATVAEALAALEEREMAEQQVSRLVGGYEPALERHRFAVFPKLAVKVQYAWECLHGGSPFKHHIQPNLANPPPTEPDANGNPPPDKYAAFRARGLRLQVDVAISAQDKPAVGVEAGPLPGFVTTLRWPGLVDDDLFLPAPTSPSASTSSPGTSAPASPEKDRPKSLPTRSSSGGYDTANSGGRPRSARVSGVSSASSAQTGGPSLALRPCLIMRLDLLRWLKHVSNPPAQPRGRRPSSLSSSSGSSPEPSPRRRRRRDVEEGKALSPNFGRLLSGMNLHVQVEQPCLAMWPGRRIGLEGVQGPAATGGVDASSSPLPKSPSSINSSPRRMSSGVSPVAGAGLKGFEGRGMLILMRDLIVQHVTELLPGQESRSLTATTPLASRTLLSRQDAEGVSLFLMDFLRCHDAAAWRLPTPGLSTPAPSPRRTSAHERSVSTPLTGARPAAGVEPLLVPKESPFYAETARFMGVLDALYAARQPEDFLSGTRYLEVNADSTGKAEEGALGRTIDPLKGYSLQRGSARALSLSRSFSLDSLGSNHGGARRDAYEGVRPASRNESSGCSPAPSPKNGRDARLEQDEEGEMEGQQEEEEVQSFRPSFASFVLNHQMMRPPPASVPAFHNTDLPRWRDPTPPPAAGIVQGLSATDRRRRRSNPLLQSSSFGEGGAARRRDSPTGASGEGEQALSPGAGPALATTVVIVTELRILWTLAARTAVNHFSTQMTRHIQAYNGTKVAMAPAAGDDDDDDEDGDDASSGSESEGEESGMPAGLAWQDSKSDLMSGASTIYSSPPPGEEGQSDLMRFFLQQKGAPNSTATAPSPSSYTSQRRRSTMLGGVGGGLDMRALGAGGGSAADGGRAQQGSRARRKEDYRVTFKVILLYPQINFRSENANGSFIIAAKEAYMEGRKHDKLFKERVDQPQQQQQQQQQQQPQQPASQPLSPKRRPPVKLLEKSEQWLRIDNVRAYVVPLDVEATREVHWLKVVPPSSRADARTGAGGDEAGGNGGTLSALLGVPVPQRGNSVGSRGTAVARPSSLSPKWGQQGPTAASASTGGDGGGGSGSGSGDGYALPKKRVAYEFRGTAVVQEVVQDFSITFASIAFNPAVLPAPDADRAQGTEGEGGSPTHPARRIRVSSEETVGKVLLDLPQLDWNLNSRQFYITLDVVRNVLLAAPVKTEEEEEEARLQSEARQREERRRRAALAAQAGAPADAPERALDLSSKSDREVLKTLVEAALQRLAAASGGVLHETKVVQYCVGGGTWRVKAEEGRLTRYDAVEVGFTGFSGQHVYFHDGSMDSTIQVESFWVRNLMPGPDSALFQDDVTTVMCPVVTDKQPCQRCGQPFEHDDNRSGACVFHATADGVPGEFRLLSEEEIERQHREQQLREEEAEALGVSSSPLLEEAEEGDGDGGEGHKAASAAAATTAKGPPGTSSLLHRHTSYHRLRVVPPITGRWTCCGATHETAPGCRARAHVGKETMLNVRAKSHAPMLVAGVEVQPYQFLELAIFPGANYKLTIQLTRNVMELFHAYFLTQEQTGGPGAGGGPGGSGDDTAETKSNLLFGKSAVEQKHKAAQQGGKASSLAGRFTKSFLGGGGAKQQQQQPSSSSSSSSSSPRTQASSGGGTATAGGDPSGGGSIVAAASSGSSSTSAATGSSAEPVVYMKYVRIGDLNIKASVSGFAIKLDGYRASIHAFVRQGRVLTWKRLIRKFEKHVAWSVTTSAASSMVGGGKSAHHHRPPPAPLPQLLPGVGRGLTAAQGSRDKEEKEREKGVNTLFSPPAQEDRSRLLFGSKR